jgi:hypothetical protein
MTFDMTLVLDRGGGYFDFFSKCQFTGSPLSGSGFNCLLGFGSGLDSSLGGCFDSGFGSGLDSGLGGCFLALGAAFFLAAGFAVFALLAALAGALGASGALPV